jgi:hypothetical protein
MGKALKAVGTAIVIVGAIAATGGAALALGAGATLGGALSLASSAVLSVGGFSVSAGTLLTVGNLVASVGGALSQPKVSTAGSALGWVGDPNGPLHFAAGRIAVGGDLRHKKAYGPNDRMYFSAVTVVSDAGPIDAFESFTANDIAVTFDASGKANSSYYANVMWRRTQLGRQPEASYLASPSGLEGGATLPNWGAAHKLSAKAAFILTLAENSKQSAYKGQQPKPRHVIRGLKVYDWRLDSTQSGGFGPHRLDNPTTWTYSANPILWAVKWILGLWEGPDYGGAPQLDTQVGGMGVKIENIDLPAFTEAANIAATHGWTCAAWPSTDDDKAQVLDAFLQAGGAYYIQRGGKESCIHRAAPRVSVATISAADTAGPIELDTGASFTQRKNCGVPTYLSEPDGWKMTALGLVSSDQWIEEDGGRERSAPVTYSYVSRAKQAAELMCLAIAHTREGIRGRIPLKPYMQGIQPGSAFTITEPEFVLNGLKCLCLETSYDAMTGVHTVTFVSESDGKYAFAFGQAPNPPAPPALEAVDPTYVTPPLPIDWTITPRPGNGAGQLPTFDLSGVVSNNTATSILVEFYEVSEGADPAAKPPVDPGWQSAGVWPPTATSIPITVQPDRYYWIGIKYIRGSNYSARTVWGPYLAGKLVAGLDPDVYAELDEQSQRLIAADIAEAVGRYNDVIRRKEEIRQESAERRTGITAVERTVQQVATDLSAEVTTRTDQVAAINGNVANVSGAVSTLATNVSAVANRTTVIEAQVQGPSGLLSRATSLESRTAAVENGKASASSVETLTARVGDVEGSIVEVASVAVDALGKVNTVVSWALTADGKVAGLVAMNNGVVSKIIFDFDSAEFTGDVIVGGTITNDKLAQDAVTGVRVAYAGGTISLNNATPTRIHGQWIDVKKASSGVDIKFMAWATFRHDAGGSFAAAVQLVRSRTLTGGEVIQSFPIAGSGMANDTWQGPIPVMFVDIPGETGDWHYYVQIYFNVGNMTLQNVNARYAQLTELKNNTATVEAGTGTGAGVGSGGGTGGGGNPGDIPDAQIEV